MTDHQFTLFEHAPKPRRKRSKSSWDKKYYNACKKHMDYIVSHRPWCCDCSLNEWLKTWVAFVKEFADKGDYEAAQASKDAIIDFVAKITGKPVSRESLLIFKS